MSRRRGSALIITLLLMSILTGLVLALQSQALANIASFERQIAATQAYTAAEAGLEHGLLQYRFNRDAEVTLANWQALVDKRSLSPVLISAERLRPSAGYGLDWTSASYGYRLGYLDTAEQKLRLAQDTALALRLPASTLRLEISWQPESPNRSSRAPLPDYALEAVISRPQAGGQINEERFIFVPTNRDRAPLILTRPIEAGRPSYLKLKPWDMLAAVLTVKAFGPNDTPLPLDRGSGELFSEGQANGRRVRLSLPINRTSGSSFEANDFLFLSGRDTLVIP